MVYYITLKIEEEYCYIIRMGTSYVNSIKIGTPVDLDGIYQTQSALPSLQKVYNLY